MFSFLFCSFLLKSRQICFNLYPKNNSINLLKVKYFDKERCNVTSLFFPYLSPKAKIAPRLSTSILRTPNFSSP